MKQFPFPIKHYLSVKSIYEFLRYCKISKATAKQEPEDSWSTPLFHQINQIGNGQNESKDKTCIQGSDCTKDENCLSGHCMPVPIWNGKEISMKYVLKDSENFTQEVNSRYFELTIRKVCDMSYHPIMYMSVYSGQKLLSNAHPKPFYSPMASF